MTDLAPNPFIFTLYIKEIIFKFLAEVSRFFFSLSSKIVGRVQIKNLSKYFVKNWQELFPVGKLVKAKVLRY